MEAPMTQYVYTFGAGKAQGRAEMKNLLGGKAQIWLK
jgi:pyruvate,orthophosphate dikinase